MKKTLLISALLSSASAHAAWQVGTVTVTDLGTLGGPRSAALDINESGQIVGWSDTPLAHTRGFLYQNGTMSPVQSVLASWTSSATGINDSGAIVGTMFDQAIPNSPSYGYRVIGNAVAVLWGTQTEWGYQGTEARAINNSRQIAGRWLFTPEVNFSAMMWQPDTSKVDLEYVTVTPFPNPNPYPYSVATDINSAGDMSGLSKVYQYGVLWHWSSPEVLVKILVPFPAPVGSPLENPANGINDHSHVVGYSWRSVSGGSRERAYFWNGESASAEYIGVLPGGQRSWAEDINDGGFIVGHSEMNDLLPSPLFSPTLTRAFLHHRDFGMVALPALAAVMPYGACRAYGLNERKSTQFMEVVGMCEGNGVSHAVRWTIKILSVRG